MRLMNIDYNHEQNRHTLEGPKAALPLLFPEGMPPKILDVGCGTGTWLRAALDLGAGSVMGVDGVEVDTETLLFDSSCFQHHDLTQPLNLHRSFDVVLCLEVGEHLPPQCAPTLVQTLTRHADTIVFSAACPRQSGQHHVNCQWPEYWQELFNQCGYMGGDSLRWKLWEVEEIEPWYRQNIFLARKDPDGAGKEPRIRRVVHPEIELSGRKATEAQKKEVREEQMRQIEKGSKSVAWYWEALFSAHMAKVKRLFSTK